MALRDPSPAVSGSPPSPCCPRAGSCCHLLATLCAGDSGPGWHAAWGEGCRDNGSSRPQNGARTEEQPKADPAPQPSHPSSPEARWHPQLYPPVMVAASRRVPEGGTGLGWGQAVTAEPGLGWAWQAGGLWLGRVSRGTGVSSLAGVARGPGCHGERHRAPGLPGAAHQSPFSGPCLGGRSCSGDARGFQGHILNPHRTNTFLEAASASPEAGGHSQGSGVLAQESCGNGIQLSSTPEHGAGLAEARGQRTCSAVAAT